MNEYFYMEPLIEMDVSFLIHWKEEQRIRLLLKVFVVKNYVCYYTF